MALYGQDPRQMGTYHMVGNSGYEPQRTNNFEVQIVGLDRLVYPANGKSTFSQPSNASELVTLSVASYSAPQINISTISVAYGNNTLKYAGKPEFPDSSIVLNDYIGINIERILSNWQKTVYDYDTQKIGLAENYKRDAYLLEFAPDGSNLRQWMLHGCWPAQLQLGDFNQEGGSVRQCTLSLVYDWAQPL